MDAVRNLDGKMVCGIDHEVKRIEIIRKECVTTISVKPDGSIHVTQERVAKTR
jgi:hypothetical protein